MEAEFIRELDAPQAGQKQCLVKLGEDYFVVSSIPSAPDHGGPETLAFPSDDEGNIADYIDVAGGRGVSREECIAELSEKGADPSGAGRGMCADPENPTMEDFLGGLSVVLAATRKGL